MTVKHTQMPHGLGDAVENIKLEPTDKLVYVYMRSHINSNNIAKVSLDYLAEECEIDRRTVAKSITRLLGTQEITLLSDNNGKKARSYKFNKDSRHFEMFSQECLDHLKDNGYSVNEKCLLICIHEYTYKTTHHGDLNDTLDEISKKINMPLRTLKRTMKSLIEKGIIEPVKKNNQIVRRVEWKKIMMDMIYQVKKNTEDIEMIKNENENLRSELNELKKVVYANKTM